MITFLLIAAFFLGALLGIHYYPRPKKAYIVRAGFGLDKIDKLVPGKVYVADETLDECIRVIEL